MPKIRFPNQPSRVQTSWTARGILAEPYHISISTSQLSPTSQTAFGSLIGLSAGDTVTNLVANVVTAGAGTAPTLIKLGLYDKTGVLLASTANVKSDAGWLAQGPKSSPLSTPYSVTVTDGYYVVFLVNGSWGTTAMLIERVAGSTNSSNAIGTGVPPGVTMGTANTDLPSPGTPAAGANVFWLAAA